MFFLLGYGNTVPKTVAGRLFLIFYATIGIPLNAMMLTTFGDKLKYIISSGIMYVERKMMKRSKHLNIHRTSLITVCVLTAVFLCSISAVSVVADDWDFSLALYVWFVTFTTIGFGDYIPAGSGTKNPIYNSLEKAYSMVAFFLGLVLIATILHALSDWVNSKRPPTKADIKRSLGRMASSLSTNKEEASTHQEESSTNNKEAS